MTAAELAHDINRRIRRNLGTFQVPKFNCVGDPFDKHNVRPVLSKRAGLQNAPAAEYWKQGIYHESAVYARPTAAVTAPGPSAAAAPALPASANAQPGAATPTPLVLNPPGWYWMPTVGPQGEAAWVQVYVAQVFASPRPPS